MRGVNPQLNADRILDSIGAFASDAFVVFFILFTFTAEDGLIKRRIRRLPLRKSNYPDVHKTRASHFCRRIL